MILHTYLYDPHCNYPTSDMWAQPIINAVIGISLLSLARGLATSHSNLHKPPPTGFSGVGLSPMTLLVKSSLTCPLILAVRVMSLSWERR
jgi:hypothetical protein